MIYTSPPENFNPKFGVVGCFLEKDGKFLLLNRQDHKPQANTWGAPGGKISPNENSVTAVIRELYEETGYIAKKDDITHAHKLYVRYDDYDFTYDVFHLLAKEQESIIINPEEHKEYRWVTPAESLSMNLIQDMDYCIKLCYKL